MSELDGLDFSAAEVALVVDVGGGFASSPEDFFELFEIVSLCLLCEEDEDEDDDEDDLDESLESDFDLSRRDRSFSLCLSLSFLSLWLSWSSLFLESLS